MTTPMIPEQHEGTLATGEKFYFRYRGGRAALGIGVDMDDAIASSNNVSMNVGAPLQGCFYSQSQRDTVFTVLMNKYLETEPDPEDAS